MPVSARQNVFTPEFLAQLERLSIASRRSFRGRVKGERRSPRKGQSVEFSDYRAYGVGERSIVGRHASGGPAWMCAFRYAWRSPSRAR